MDDAFTKADDPFSMKPNQTSFSTPDPFAEGLFELICHVFEKIIYYYTFIFR